MIKTHNHTTNMSKRGNIQHACHTAAAFSTAVASKQHSAHLSQQNNIQQSCHTAATLSTAVASKHHSAHLSQQTIFSISLATKRYSVRLPHRHDTHAVFSVRMTVVMSFPQFCQNGFDEIPFSHFGQIDKANLHVCQNDATLFRLFVALMQYYVSTPIRFT